MEAKRETRRYTTEERMHALTLYATNGNAEAVARELDMPARTVRKWVTSAFDGSDEAGGKLLAGQGRALRAKLIDQVERGMSEAIDETIGRISSKDWALNFKGDPTPQYISSLGQLYGKLQDADRLADEREGKLQGARAEVTFLVQDVSDLDDDPPLDAA